MTVFKRRPKAISSTEGTRTFIEMIQNCRRVVSTKYPDLCSRTSIIIGCPDAEKEHLASFRQFAHVGHYGGVICFSVHTIMLSPGHQCGLLLHEYGHMINSFLIENGILPKESYTEETADRMVRDCFGIRIKYRRIEPYQEGTFQKGVEWVDSEVVRKLAR